MSFHDISLKSSEDCPKCGRSEQDASYALCQCHEPEIETVMAQAFAAFSSYAAKVGISDPDIDNALAYFGSRKFDKKWKWGSFKTTEQKIIDIMGESEV
jgi:hypothetical protein